MDPQPCALKPVTSALSHAILPKVCLDEFWKPRGKADRKIGITFGMTNSVVCGFRVASIQQALGDEKLLTLLRSAKRCQGLQILQIQVSQECR